jgi:hypothetical protein
MVTKKLKFLFGLSLLLIAFHGVEEVTTGFLYKDSFISFFSELFTTKGEIFYWTFHIMWWFMLLAVFLVLLGRKWVLIPMSLFGIVFFFEIHHLFKAILTGEYYPGMVSAFFYPILGIFYWKELISSWRKNYGRS